MLQKAIGFTRAYISLYNGRQLSRSAAALAYSLTMSFFPLLICLYTLLGNSYETAMRIIGMVQHLMATETVQFLRDFMGYVASNESNAMFVAGIMVLVTSAAASVRSLQTTISELQGRQRYQGLGGFLISFVFSLLFIAAIYISVLIMLTGRSIMTRLSRYLLFIDISNSWNAMRYLVLAGIFFLMIWGVYKLSVTKEKNFHSWPGALLATAAMVGVSAAFSVFFSASTRYPLVYGSIASIILLMLWLYDCCLVIYCGAAFNVVLRDTLNARSDGDKESEPQ